MGSLALSKGNKISLFSLINILYLICVILKIQSAKATSCGFMGGLCAGLFLLYIYFFKFKFLFSAVGRVNSKQQ